MWKSPDRCATRLSRGFSQRRGPRRPSGDVRLAVLTAAAALVLAAGFGAAGALSPSGAAAGRVPSARLGTGNPVRGKKVFVQAGCGACHTIVAAGSKGTIGPNLDKALAGKSASSVRQSIVKPNAVIAKGYKPNVMPGIYGGTLSKRQLDDLVAFLIQKRR